VAIADHSHNHFVLTVQYICIARYMLRPDICLSVCYMLVLFWNRWTSHAISATW